MGTRTPGRSQNRYPQVIDIIKLAVVSPLRDEGLLKEKYLQEGLSPKQIALQLGVSRPAVVGRLKRIGVLSGAPSRPGYLLAQVPFGWKRENGKLVSHLAEQRVLERISKARAEGESLHSIARSLTIAGIKAKNGGKWHARTVSRILERNESFFRKNGRRPQSK